MDEQFYSQKLITAFPEDLSKNIAKKHIKSSISTKYENKSIPNVVSIEETDDKLWLFSMWELTNNSRMDKETAGCYKSSKSKPATDPWPTGYQYWSSINNRDNTNWSLQSVKGFLTNFIPLRSTGEFGGKTYNFSYIRDSLLQGGL